MVRISFPRRIFNAAILLALVLVFANACGSDTIDPSGEVDDAGTEVSDVADMGDDPDTDNAPDTETDPENTPDFGLFDFGEPEDMEPPADFLSITSVAPERGSVDGDTPIVIEGTGFSADSVVFFGANEATVEFVDGRLVGRTPPASAPGPVLVKVLDPEFEETAVLADAYEYIEPLTIDTILPTQSPTTGGVEVTLSGRGFDQFTRISFGGQSATRHTVVSSNLMRVLTPQSSTTGLVDVRATSRDATVVVPDGFTYFASLKLDTIRPASADPSGAIDVAIYGSGFEPTMTIDFGGNPGVVKSVAPSGEEATVEVPAHPAGLVDVAVQTELGTYVAEDAFYYADPAVFSVARVSPSQGVASGGTEVTIVGSGFNPGALSIEFDGLPAPQIIASGPTFVTVETPAHSPGMVDVTVFSDGASQTLVDAFEYVEDIWVDSVTPDQGSADGGDVVTIAGEGFTGATLVRFGQRTTTNFTVISDTEIEVTTPSNSAGTTDVVVERSEVEARFIDGFTFTEPLELFGFKPVRGSIAGNTYVTVFGQGFFDGMQLTFDGLPATTLDVLDGQTLVARTPPHPSGQVDVEADNGVESALAPTPYTYFNPGARFGGAWGAPVDGSVNVTVFEMGGDPVENAFVLLSTNANTPYQGYTDVNGMITLSGPDVLGVQTVSAVAAGLSSATVQRVDAENITLFLQPPPPQGEGNMESAGATFNGTVTGIDKIERTGPLERTIAIVTTTQVNRSTQNPDPGGGNVVIGDGPYTLNSRVGDLALVAIGGVVDDISGDFSPRFMGVKRFLVAADGQTYTEDIDLDIPLDNALTFKLDQPPLHPNGPSENEIVPWLSFGFEGVFGGLPRATGTGDFIVAEQMPELTGPLDGVSVTAVGGSITPGGGPSSIAFKRNITSYAQIVAMPPLMGIARVTSPAQGVPPTNGLVQFDLNTTNQPDFIYAVLVDFNFNPVWEIFLPGDARSFRFPDFPDFSHLPVEDRPVPYPGQQLILQILTISTPGFNFNNVSYNDLSLEGWSAYGVNGLLFTL